jgi:hypothetical protein
MMNLPPTSTGCAGAPQFDASLIIEAPAPQLLTYVNDQEDPPRSHPAHDKWHGTYAALGLLRCTSPEMAHLQTLPSLSTPVVGHHAGEDFCARDRVEAPCVGRGMGILRVLRRWRRAAVLPDVSNGFAECAAGRYRHPSATLHGVVLQILSDRQAS